MDEAGIRRIVNEAVQTAAAQFAATAAAAQANPNPNDSAGNPATPSDQAARATERRYSFRPRDIGYFDPNSSAMPIEVKDNHNIYHDFYSFAN